MRASTPVHTKGAMASKLEEIRAAVAECSVVEDGVTQDARQRENARRVRVFRMLDAYSQELSARTAASSNEGIEVIRQQQQEQQQ